MKCISVYPEVIDEFLSGEKTKEYRLWSTDYRGDILIACTKTDQSNPFICIAAKIVDCIKENDVYAFILENITPIKILPVKGQQRIYNVDYTEKDIIPINPDDEKAINDMFLEADEWLTIKKKKRA